MLFDHFSILIRIELNSLGLMLTFGDGVIYNRLITAHGLGMVFLFIMPLLISFLGNWKIPVSFSMQDFALPRINILAYYTLVLAALVLILALSRDEGVGTGWTVYVPLSDFSFHSSTSINLAIVGLHLLGLSSEGGAVIFLVSCCMSRATGIFLSQGCLLSWSLLNASLLLILTLPVLGSGITLLLCDRILNCVFYLGNSGGDVLIYQHLFWYFGHPEVYVIILPAFGLVSNVLARATQLALSAQIGMIIAVISIAVVGCFVWAHHMFVAGILEESRLYFSSASMVIAIPTAMKIFTWVTSLYSLRICVSDIFLVTLFIICFTIGGFTGIVLSNSSVDIIYHDTYYVVGHFHYVLSIAALLACIIGLLGFKDVLFVSGSQTLTRYSLVILLSGINWIFVFQHSIGINGHPRRIFQSAEVHVVLIELSNFTIVLLFFIPGIVTCTQHAFNSALLIWLLNVIQVDLVVTGVCEAVVSGLTIFYIH